MVHLITVGKFLKFAVTTCFAEHTEMVTFGKQQFEYLAAIFFELFRIGFHYQSFADRVRARRNRSSFSLYLNHAHPAGTHVGKAGTVTETGNVDPVCQTGIQDGFVVLYGIISTVNADIYTHS
jgi:hypothetical protein